jgi:outer membrane protease
MGVCLVLSGVTPVWGDGLDFNMNVGAGRMSGETVYQIGGHVAYANGRTDKYWFPVSELDWPLDFYVASAHADLTIHDTVHVGADVVKNISKAAGWMKDSDWVNAPDSFDVYSESQTRGEALLWNANVDYIFHHSEKKDQKVAVMLGAGFRHQKFGYHGYAVHEEYPSSPSTPPYDLQARVITYAITYEVPYVELAAFSTYGRLTGYVHLGWSPFAMAEDVDHHLLRNKVCRGVSDNGAAYLLGMRAGYELIDNWSLGCRFDYTKINTQGTQKQWNGDAYYAELDWKALSEQMLIQITLGYSF